MEVENDYFGNRGITVGNGIRDIIKVYYIHLRENVLKPISLYNEYMLNMVTSLGC